MYIFLILVSLLNFSYGGKLEVKNGWVRPAGKGMKVISRKNGADA